MMDFYFVIIKNDSQGDVVGRGFLVGYWVDSRAACFAVCANSCCRARQVWFVMHFFPSEKNTKYQYALKNTFSRTFQPVTHGLESHP